MGIQTFPPTPWAKNQCDIKPSRELEAGRRTSDACGGLFFESITNRKALWYTYLSHSLYGSLAQMGVEAPKVEDSGLMLNWIRLHVRGAASCIVWTVSAWV